MGHLTDLLNEDSPLQPVQEKSKQGWLFLASILVGLTICVPVFVMGADLVHKLPYEQFALGALLGGALAGIIAYATGLVGQRTGLSTAMLAKIAFGSRGYIIPNLLMLIVSVGWFGIQAAVFAKAFVKLSDQVIGVTLNETVVILVSGLLMSSTAVIGFRGLGKLTYICVPLLIFMLLIPLYFFYYDGNLVGVTHFSGVQTMTLGTMIALVGGGYSFAAGMPDVTRFMRTKMSMAMGVVTNFIFAYPILLILTGTVALAAGENDYMQILLMLEFGGLAILVLFLATWTTNDTNVYTGALSVNLFLPKYPRWKIAAAVGVLGTVFAVAGIFEHFMSWLILSGNLFGPMAGVYVADYWLNQGKYSQLDNIPTYRSPQLVALVVGIVVGLFTTSHDNMGFELMTLTTVPIVDGIVAAALVQFILHKIIRAK